MDNDNDIQPGFKSALDPKLMLAATTLLIAASIGTWKAFSPAFAAARHQRAQMLEDNQKSLIANADSNTAADKKKRSKDRRKRAPAQKLPRAASTSSHPQGIPSAKKVIRQPSALSSRRNRPLTPSISEHSESIPETFPVDETPRPTSIPRTPHATLTQETTVHSTLLSGDVNPAEIPLPTSPILGRTQTPPPSFPSPSASTSANTSAWQWEGKHNDDHSPSPRRGRQPASHRSKGSDHSASATTFPTLNTLPPPNTPLEVQIDFMKNQVESFRTQEQINRAREEALVMELERLRAEAEQSRQDVSRLQWQLSDM
ncbi:1169_t:CDS:2, partial [Acaulospora colombiana]